MTTKTRIGNIVIFLTLLFLVSCSAGSPPTPPTTEIGTTLVCDLPDGMGTLVATDVVVSTEGRRVMGVVTMTLDSGDVFTATGPLDIAPEMLCIVGESVDE